MENNGYGQLRQDVGKLMGIGERLEIGQQEQAEALRNHSEEDQKRFSILEKWMYMATGAIGILGIGTVAQLFKDFLIR